MHRKWASFAMFFLLGSAYLLGSGVLAESGRDTETKDAAAGVCVAGRIAFCGGMTV